MGCLNSAAKQVADTVQQQVSAAATGGTKEADAKPQHDPNAVWKQLVLDGDKKSLLIGINYIGQKGELRGCVNDVLKMKNYLISEGFPSDDDHMLLLTEEEDGFNWPTRDRIIEGIGWLVEGAKKGDNLFFHYSGHGTRIADKSGDEKDGYDEALVPLDYSKAGMILDDEVNMLMADNLPEGVRLSIIMDCCHSGSACDLPYSFLATKENTFNWKEELPQMILSRSWEWNGLGGLTHQVKDLVQDVREKWNAEGEEQPGFSKVSSKATEASIVMFSGCKDKQTSADVRDTSTFELPEDCGPGGAGGACTHAFLSVVHEKPDVCFIELLEEMRVLLEEKRFTQVPMLSSSKVIELGSPFRLNA